MSRFFLAILLVISTVAVVAHGSLVYHFSTTAAIAAEEEGVDDKPFSKDGKEKVATIFYTYRYLQVKKLHTAAFEKSFSCSKGFYNKPYNPPEVI